MASTTTTTEDTYILSLRLPFKMLRKMDRQIAAVNRKRVDMDINRSSYMRHLLAKELNHAG